MSPLQVHEAIKRTPFEATFGQRAHLGLRDSKIPRSIAATLRTQQELEEVAARNADVVAAGPSNRSLLQSPSPPLTRAPSSPPSPPPTKGPSSPPSTSLTRAAAPSSLPPTRGSSSPPSLPPSRISLLPTPLRSQTTPQTPGEPQPGPSGLQCVFCGLPVDHIETDDGCRLCKKANSAKRHREKAAVAQQRQALKMLRTTRQSRLHAGQTVRVGIPDLDRARNQPRNILAIITEVS